MAIVKQASAYVSFLDDAGRTSNVQFRVSVADAEAYATAADEAAAALTKVGLLLSSVQALSDLTVVDRGVRVEFANDAAAEPGINAYRGNKAVFGFAGGGRNFTMSVPGRKNSVLNLDGVSIPVDAPGYSSEVQGLETNLIDTALTIDGSAITGINKGYIND